MIRSMTGFGAAELVIGANHHRLEIKSVNGKFCDVKVKLPLDLSSVEIRIQNHIRGQLARGHVDVLLYRGNAATQSSRGLMINWDLAEQYYKAFQSLRHKFGINQDVGLSMLTNARDVIVLQQEEEDPEALWTRLEAALVEALKSLIEMRESEGKSLAQDMATRLNLIKERLIEIAKLSPAQVDAYKTRLEEKLAGLKLPDIDHSRLAQEVCLFADRCDITEEITRLRSHIQQFFHFLEEKEPVGRKLDFLIQEMNREANTMGSKCNSASISQAVVEIKSELEKLREQIQNVE